MAVSRRKLPIAGLARVLTAVCLPLVAFFASADGTVSDAIRARVETLASGSAVIIRGSSVTTTRLLPALYQQREFAAVWHNPRSIAQLLRAAKCADEDGLNPGDYHVAALEDLHAALAGAAPDPAQAADFDLLLTDSLIRLVYHLLIGKVDPVELDSTWNFDRRINGDAARALSSAIDGGTIDELLDSLRPQHDYYRRLRGALARYRAIAEQGGWPGVPAGPSLKRGITDARVVALRRRLAVTQDLPGEEGPSASFDEPLEAAVKTFQRRHGLTADGIVGRHTLAALNVPVAARIDQIRVNLERARWVLHDMPDEYVLVDIAGFNVRYVRRGQTVWESRAVVGRPYRKTPIFRSQLTYLEMNPTWTVPPTILRNDVLPAIKRDIAYLAENDMRVIDYDHNVVDPASIDWQRYRGPDFPHLIRQDPGPNNPLGRIKFMFPNKHLVYLHDTPGKTLFERTERAFSSGCIRLENPYEFAELLLDDPAVWSREAILRMINTRQTRQVSLPRPVTILLLYLTVTPDGSGDAVFKQDIYDRDAGVLAELNSELSLRQPAFTRADGAHGI